MSDAAKALVQKLVEAGEWPDPALMEEIVAQGQEAVEPLLEIVRTQPHGWPAEAPLDHAVALLCTLRPPEALPALIELFRHYANETAETVAECAAVYGPDVIEPALAVARETGLPYYSRSTAISLATRGAGRDPDLRSRIAATLRELLAHQLARAPEFVSEEEEDEDPDDEGLDDEDFDEDQELEDELDDELGGDLDADADAEDGPDEEGGEGAIESGSVDDYFQMTTTLVMDLAGLADPQARDLIRDAYQADIVDRWMIEEADVDRYYAEGGDMPSPPDPLAPLQRYREHYEAHQAAKKRTPLTLAPPPPPPRLPAQDRYEEPTLHPFVHAERKPGRNEPCWCGSGKKYKKCHMGQDRK
jgi:hypothetical protein